MPEGDNLKFFSFFTKLKKTLVEKYDDDDDDDNDGYEDDNDDDTYDNMDVDVVEMQRLQEKMVFEATRA